MSDDRAVTPRATARSLDGKRRHQLAMRSNIGEPPAATERLPRTVKPLTMVQRADNYTIQSWPREHLTPRQRRRLRRKRGHLEAALRRLTGGKP